MPAHNNYWVNPLPLSGGKEPTCRTESVLSCGPESGRKKDKEKHSFSKEKERKIPKGPSVQEHLREKSETHSKKSACFGKVVQHGNNVQDTYLSFFGSPSKEAEPVREATSPIETELMMKALEKRLREIKGRQD